VTEDPLATDYMGAVGTRNELPRVVGDQGIEFRLHRLALVGIFEGLIHYARDRRDGRHGCCPSIGGLGLNVPARALVTMGWGARAVTGAGDEVEATVDDRVLCARVVDDEDGHGDGDRGEASGESGPPWSCTVGGLGDREGDGGGGVGGASSVALRSRHHGS
jgi:hypothetical protein